METVFLMILGIVIFTVGIMISVGAHEAGHMAAARLFKLHVPEFFVGFGPKMFSFKKGETEYGVRWIPLGGFVKIKDRSVFEGSDKINFENLSEEKKQQIEEEQEVDSLLLRHVKPWKRQIIYIAGPAVNILIGTFILFGILLGTPVHVPTNTVNEVDSCSSSEVVHCGAESAGIQSGDTIVAVDGTTVGAHDSLFPYMKDKESVDLTVLRDGSSITLEDVVVKNGKIGIFVETDERDRGPAEAAVGVVGIYKLQGEALLRLPQAFVASIDTVFSNERNPDTPTSIVGMGRVYGDVAATDKIGTSDKAFNMIYYMAMINLGLGFLNLIPILPLDGGRMLIAAIDSVRGFLSRVRKRAYIPLSSSVISRATVIMFVPLIVFMAAVIVADIKNPVSIF